MVTAELAKRVVKVINLFLISQLFFFSGVADGDIDLADRLLQPCLLQYPKGALFLFYAGRVQEIRGHIDEVSSTLLCTRN